MASKWTSGDLELISVDGQHFKADKTKLEKAW